MHASNLVNEIGAGRWKFVELSVLETTFQYFCKEFKEIPIKNWDVASKWIHDKKVILLKTPKHPRVYKRRASRLDRAEILKNMLEPLAFCTESTQNDKTEFISRAKAWLGGHKCLEFRFKPTPEFKSLTQWTTRSTDTKEFVVSKQMANDVKMNPVVHPGDIVIKIGRVFTKSTKSTDCIQSDLDAYLARTEKILKDHTTCRVLIFRKSGNLTSLCKSLSMPPPVTKIIIFERLSEVVQLMWARLKETKVMVYVLNDNSKNHAFREIPHDPKLMPVHCVKQILHNVKAEYQTVHPNENIINSNVLYFESRTSFSDAAYDAGVAIVEVLSRKNHTFGVGDWLDGMAIVWNYFKTGDMEC